MIYILPVWETVGDCYRFIWAERRAWFDYVLGPVFAVSVIPLLLMWIFLGTFQIPLGPTGLPDIERSGGSPLGMIFLIWFLMIGVYVSFAVAWHRRVLLGPDHTSARELFSWQRRHWTYAGQCILILLLSIMVGIVIGFLVSIPLEIVAGVLSAQGGNPANLVALAALTWIAAALAAFAIMAGPMLAFPATAIDDTELGIRAGWKLARGNRWRMVGVYILGVFIPVLIVQVLLIGLIGSGLSTMEPESLEGVRQSFSFSLIINLISNAVYFLGVAIGMSMLSIMYRRLRDNVPSNESASA